jgi:hypothetical protein
MLLVEHSRVIYGILSPRLAYTHGSLIKYVITVVDMSGSFPLGTKLRLLHLPSLLAGQRICRSTVDIIVECAKPRHWWKLDGEGNMHSIILQVPR